MEEEINKQIFDMSKVILYIAESLDGFIATPEGSVDWLDQFNDLSNSDDYGYSEFIRNIDINIQGANTYKQVLGFDVPWPYTSKSYIVTHQELDLPENGDVEFYEGDLVKLVSKLKKESKKDIWLIGGASLIQDFLNKKLIDEMIIFIMPMFLGNGISLFGGEGGERSLKLVESKEYKSGVVELRYSL